MTNLSNMLNQDQTLFDWVANIIKSCYHDFHFEGADRLIAYGGDVFYANCSIDTEGAENISKRLVVITESNSGHNVSVIMKVYYGLTKAWILHHFIMLGTFTTTQNF